MARFTEAELERLKAEVSLVRLVEAKGVVLKKHGKDWLGRCPFHDDKTPSLVVSPATNLWHCLGACNVGGSVIDWVMKTDGVSFRHAVELLRHDLPHLAAASGSESATEANALKRSTVPKLASPLVADGDEQALLRQVVDYYHETLQQSPEALAYLEARGLNHPELIATFQLGYANRSLAYRLPQKNRQAGAELRGRLQALGVLRESGHEHLNGSLVVPLLNESGDVVQLYGRKINDNLRPGTAYHLYLPGDHAGVWNLAGLRGAREVILCEALLRDVTGWGNTQLKVHLGRLEDMEYLALHSSARSKAIAYELRFDGAAESHAPHLMGLIDVAALKKHRSATAPGVALPPASMQLYDGEKSGAGKAKSGLGRPQVGPVSGHGRGGEIAENPEKTSLKLASVTVDAENASLRKHNGASYRSDGLPPLAAAGIASAALDA